MNRFSSGVYAKLSDALYIMMLGNLLGHIDALLSDELEDSMTVVKLSEQGNDKRKGICLIIIASDIFRGCHGKDNKCKNKHNGIGC